MGADDPVCSGSKSCKPGTRLSWRLQWPLQGQTFQQHGRGEHGIRYIVLEITETQQEKLLRMVSTASGAEVTARLCDAW